MVATTTTTVTLPLPTLETIGLVRDSDLRWKGAPTKQHSVELQELADGRAWLSITRQANWNRESVWLVDDFYPSLEIALLTISLVCDSPIP